jgi:poly(glycerol-phosphate) alpha-glucosyltransferase
MAFFMGNNPNPARAEFEKEAASFKRIIYEMIENGQMDMVAQLLEQYTLLNPSDPDIKAFKDMLNPGGVAPVNEKKEIPEEYGILNGIETVFILSGLIFKRVGYIDSVLRKIKLMEDKWNYKPLILTCLHNVDQKQALTWLRTASSDQVTVSAETRVLNVYDYFQKSYAEGLENKAVYSSDDDGTRRVEVSTNTYDVFASDVLVRQEFFTGYAGALRLVRYYEDGKKVKDNIYDDWGYLNSVRVFDPMYEDRYTVNYYTTSGYICIEALYMIINDASELDKLIVYDEFGSIIAECADNAELAAFCLEQLMSDEKFYILVVEDGLMSKAATTIDKSKKNFARAIVVHNIFLSDAYDPSSEPQKYYKYLCENHSKFEAVIQLTQEARDDFGRIFKSKQNTFAIPHPYPYEISKVSFDKRDHKKAVIVARLDIVKQIEAAVDIFSMVVKELPDLKLEIYGRGPDEENIKERIKKYGLENNVLLMGYTDDPLAVFRTAALFMMTSWAEGFGLTLAESICNGCPAFAFDVKYGPSEIVTDGYTGFLFPRFDKKKYAAKLIDYFKDADLQKAMSENCYTDAPRFGTDKFLENWFNMTEALHNRR